MKNPSPATVMIACQELAQVAKRGGWSLDNINKEISSLFNAIDD